MFTSIANWSNRFLAEFSAISDPRIRLIVPTLRMGATYALIPFRVPTRNAKPESRNILSFHLGSACVAKIDIGARLRLCAPAGLDP
jgi:hypothetical protein